MINKEEFEKCSVKEKLDFIKKVPNLATRNTLTKDDLFLLIKWQNTIIEKMKCCENCKYALQGEYDSFENCGSCHATECECKIKSPTKNSFGKYHDWDDKCDNWELAERIQED